jgi:hypothetical protein
MITSGESLPVLERIRRTLVALRMPRALKCSTMRCASSNAAKPARSS